MRLVFTLSGADITHEAERVGRCYMQDFARKFYLSKAWRNARKYIIKRDMGLCVRCGKPGKIVHHKTYLTPQNIDNPYIAFGEDNLETLCRECHAIEHEGQQATAGGLMFDSVGNLVERECYNEQGM